MKKFLVLFLLIISLPSCQSLTQLIETSNLIQVEKVSGIVKSENGKGLDRVKIYAKGKTTETDVNGNYELSIVNFNINTYSTQNQKSNFTINFEKDNYEPEVVTLDDYQTSNEVQLNVYLKEALEDIQNKHTIQMLFHYDKYNLSFTISDGITSFEYRNIDELFYLDFIKHPESNLDLMQISEDATYTITYTFSNKNNIPLFTNTKTIDLFNSNQITITGLDENTEFTTKFKFKEKYAVIGILFTVDQSNDNDTTKLLSNYTTGWQFNTDEVICTFNYSETPDLMKKQFSINSYKLFITKNYQSGRTVEIIKYYTLNDLYNKTIYLD